jgi:Family of unknown function (DUF5946)
METQARCDECGAALEAGQSCQDHFHQMLYWEAEDPPRGVVHHLMVLCYHMQHPSILSQEWLDGAKGLLEDFVVRGVTPAEIRKRDSAKLDSGKRTYKIKGTPDHHGSYAQPVAWSMTAADVVAAGAERYVERVRAWAERMYENLS